LRSKDAHVPAKRKLVSEIHDVGVTSRVAAVNASSNNALFGLLLAPEVREGPSPNLLCLNLRLYKRYQVSFIRTGFREMALKIKRQRTRMVLRHQRRLLQKSEINLGREGTAQAANFPELRNEIVALKKLEQEQKELALRIAQLEEGIKRIEAERQQNTDDQNSAIAKLESEKKPLLQQRNQAKTTADVCERELAAVQRRIQENEAADRDLLKQLSDLHALDPTPPDLQARAATINARRARLPEERAELIRARLGSADAARLAKEKLVAAESELAVV
jgi:chromosome segregation ATPase